MKAWLLDSLDGFDKLRLADVPEPSPAAGEVIVRTIHSALNPADRHLALGQYPARPPMPHILGRDAVGTIHSIGDGVGGWKIGDKAILVRSDVGVHRAGTFAELFSVPAESIVRVPDGWTDPQAAGATLVYITAFQALTQFPDLPRKAVVLITGASGGVGVATLHLCKALGYSAVALSRSERKRDQLLKTGATFVADPHDTNWRRALEKSLGERRIDLAVDNIGGASFTEIFETLAMNGRISCVGRLGGPVPQFNTASLFFRRIQIRGVAISTYTPAESAAAWDRIVELLARSGNRPVIDRVFAFEDLRPAFDRLTEGPMGKVLLSAPTVPSTGPALETI